MSKQRCVRINRPGRLRWLCLPLLAALGACGDGADPAALKLGADSSLEIAEDDNAAPVDYGQGPTAPAAVPMREQMKVLADADPNAVVSYRPANGGPDAHLAGAFGPSFAWPLIPLHMVLLPDGRVLGYGSDEKGAQGALAYYAVWDPDAGAGASAFQMLDNTTGTDLFCTAQLVMPGNGQVLLVGGDRSVNGIRNYAVADVNIFNPANNQLTRQAQSMAYRRWYGTLVTMPNGDQVVMGGRDDRDYAGSSTVPPTTATYATVPELYRSGVGWRSLSGAGSADVFGERLQNWWYPKAWLAPNGKIFIATHVGTMHELDPAGSGTLRTLEGKLPFTNANTASVMYAPGKLMSMRAGTAVKLIDINGAQPVVSDGAPLSTPRRWGFATLLPDGKVWVNGGSRDANDLADAVYSSELWTPSTNKWRITASASKARLYHGSSLLLPSGAVLTGGGGAPGPVKQLNAEVYFPPYLFKKDGSGEFAPRPSITAVSKTQVGWRDTFTLDVNASTPIRRVTWVRMGSSTHSFNNEQRFFQLSFTQSGNTLAVRTPASASLAPPGYYMVFAFDDNGVPSPARVVKLWTGG